MRQDSYSWMNTLCCFSNTPRPARKGDPSCATGVTARPRGSLGTTLTEVARRSPRAPAHVLPAWAWYVESARWLQDDLLHPKFCGYRQKSPGEMPNLERFVAEPLGSNVPPHWELPGRSLDFSVVRPGLCCPSVGMKRGACQAVA